MYEVFLKNSARKELDKISPPHLSRIGQQLDKLCHNPLPAGCKKLISVARPFWRIRVGDYRIIYAIDQLTKVLEVYRIGHRNSVYKSI